MNPVRGLVAAITLVAFTGCLSTTHVIPNRDLMALAQTPPQQRGDNVRVIQGWAGTENPPEQTPVSSTTIIVVDGGGHYHGGGGGNTFGPGRPSAQSKKDDAKVWIILAAIAVVTLAFTEGLRYDGWVRLHPMHPIHLYGWNGEYMWVPLAQLTPQHAAWARKAFVRPSEGPWLQLGRAPLNRVGGTYSLLLGGGEISSYDGAERAGFLSHIQFGGFFTPGLGLMLDIGLGWRNDGERADVFDSRWALELQAFPVRAGRLHLGFFVDGGLAARFEDVPQGADRLSWLLGGGALVQVELTTRLAITARAGLVGLHEELASEFAVGLSIY
jgi:hypothetical protein